MKNNEKLIDAMGNIDDQMIDAAYKRTAEKKSRSGLFETIGTVAAVAAIAVFAVVLSHNAKKDNNIAGDSGTVSNADYTVEPGICERGQIWGDYIFRYTEKDGLKKYDIHTGERSDAVPDTLKIDSWAAIGNVLYYVTCDSYSNKSTLNAYDAATGAAQTVYETKGVLHAYDAYYERILLQHKPNAMANNEVTYFWFDTKTGKTEELDGRYIENGYMFYEFIDDRIVWRNMDESYTGDELSRYYSTDLKGTDLRKYNYDYYYGNHYRFAPEEDEDGVQHNNMYVTLAGETEEKLLIADLHMPLFTKNKIIYTKTVPMEERRVAYISESDGSKRLDQCNGDVYIMDPDGSNDRLLFHTDECISSMNDIINRRRWYVGEEYAAIFSEYELPQRGLLERVIVFNINTGEFVVEHDVDKAPPAERKTEFVDISDIKEISGYYSWSSTAENESYSYAVIKLSRLLKSASVAYLLPSLIPEGYVVTHTDMTGSIYSPEEAQNLSLRLIDNVNNVVREERDEDGRVILNTDKYNGISIWLYKKSFWENSDYCNHLKKNWFIEQDLSEYSIGRKYFPEDKEYKFLIDIGEYYVLYVFKEAEGGERDLGTSDIYRIVASTPYIKDNGYKESATPSDPVFTAPISLHGVGEVRQASFIIGSEGEVSTDYNGTAFSGGLDMSTIYGSNELRRYFPSLLPESYLVFGVATTTEDGEISRVTLKLLDDTDGSYRDGMSEAEVFSLASTHDSMYVELYIKNDANARYLEGYTEKWDVTDTLSAKGIEAKYEDLSKTINCLVDFGNVIMYYHVQERGVHGATVDSDALYRIITSTPAIDAVE